MIFVNNLLDTEEICFREYVEIYLVMLVGSKFVKEVTYLLYFQINMDESILFVISDYDLVIRKLN